MGTEIFKIEEEMTEKMKPEVANPPPKMGWILCSQYTLIDPLSHSLGHYGPSTWHTRPRVQNYLYFTFYQCVEQVLVSLHVMKMHYWVVWNFTGWQTGAISQFITLLGWALTLEVATSNVLYSCIFTYFKIISPKCQTRYVNMKNMAYASWRKSAQTTIQH